MKNHKLIHILASGVAVVHEDLITASASISTAIALNGDAAPSDIQYMPPGKHTISAKKDGKPVKLDIVVTAAAADRLNTQLQDLRAKAARGEGDLPYFDFNHNDAEASAHPTEIFWGGEDPIKGGIRARLEWSAAGSAAILGKTFRRFSPSFYADAKGEVQVMDLNAGGLVNRAAFKNIAPIWARQSAGLTQNHGGDPAETQKEKPMIEALKKRLADKGIITAADLSDEAVVDAILARDAKQTSELITAKDSIKKDGEAYADTVIAAAIKAGKIAAKDEPTISRYKGLIVADRGNASLVEGLAVRPDLAKLQEEVITAGAEERQEGRITAKAEDEHPFLIKAREYATTNKVSMEDAVVHVGNHHEALYEDYNNKLIAASAKK